MHRLMTIPLSHYCDKVRWALDLCGEPYVEDGHLPMLHWLQSLPAGAGRTVPALVLDDGRVLGDSTDILLELDRRHPHVGLYGQNPAERQDILALEDEFDRHVGPASRRLAYFHLLADRRRTIAWLSKGIPTWEARVFAGAFPLFAAMLRRGLAVHPAGAERSLARLRRSFAEVSARLGSRPYLVGDRLTAADLTFAALTSLVVLPEGHPAGLPPPDQAPEGLRKLAEELRQTVAGQHVLRLYAQRT